MPSGKAVYYMRMRGRHLFSLILIVLCRLNIDKIREILTLYTFRASYFHAVTRNTTCSFSMGSLMLTQLCKKLLLEPK